MQAEFKPGELIMPDAPRYTIIVAGLGRCGSSLVMRMLAAGGVPTVGTYPDFEDDVILRLPGPAAQREFADKGTGRVVKLLDPHLRLLPSGKYRCIFLRRDPTEQAKSMLKLIGQPADRRARRAMESTVVRDTAHAARTCRALDPEGEELTFEQLIANPRSSAVRLARIAGEAGHARLDLDAMEACVIERPTACLPYFLEMELIR